jgi:hypothetical protein
MRFQAFMTEMMKVRSTISWSEGSVHPFSHFLFGVVAPSRERMRGVEGREGEGGA